MASASASAPGTAVEASSGAAAVLVYVEVLAAYRKQCEADGRYDEADCAHQKLKQIVRDEEERQREALLVEQAREKVDLSAAHRQQLREFLEEWNGFLREAEEEARAALQQLRERHAQELAALQAERRRSRQQEKQQQQEQEVAATATTIATAADTTRTAAVTAAAGAAAASPPPPLRMRSSPELLELRRKEALLKRQRQYAEAGRVRRVADRLEAREAAAARREREAVWERREEKLRAQQALEVRAFREKAVAKRQAHLLQQDRDCRRLRQRNHNLVLLLEGRQQQERARVGLAVRRELDAAVHRGEEGGGQVAALSAPLGGGRPRSPPVMGRAGAPTSPRSMKSVASSGTGATAATAAASPSLVGGKRDLSP